MPLAMFIGAGVLVGAACASEWEVGERFGGRGFRWRGFPGVGGSTGTASTEDLARGPSSGVGPRSGVEGVGWWATVPP